MGENGLRRVKVARLRALAEILSAKHVNYFNAIRSLCVCVCAQARVRACVNVATVATAAAARSSAHTLYCVSSSS